jgi:hypothetical protein
LKGLRTLFAGLDLRLHARREMQAKLAEKNERLQNLRRQVARKDRELERLREELDRTDGRSSGEAVPAFFVVGRGRSGTSWLRILLNSHPEILCWGEGRFFERSFKRADFEQLQLENIPPSSLYRAILESKSLRFWIDRSIWARGEEPDTHLANLTRLTIDYFLAEQLSKTNKRIVGDKTPFVSPDVIEEIGTIYPEAKVIHIIRDGRDVAVSLIHFMWNHAKNEGGIFDLEPEELEKRRAYREGSLDPPAGSLFTDERLASIAEDWSTGVGKVMEDGPALLGGNYTEVRYEDLLERPIGEAQRLLEFLGVDSSVEKAKKCVERARFERKTSRKPGQEDPSSRFRKGVAGDWKSVFTEEDKRIFKEIAGNLLIELGYEKDDNW